MSHTIRSLAIGFSLAEVLPVETLLRNAWNTDRYMKGTTDVNQSKPFLVEECSKAHLQRIRDLMRDDYSWAVIAMVALLSNESDHIGSWSESCPCHPLPRQAKGRRSSANKAAIQEAKNCPFRCCRAPELAVGQGLELLCVKMMSHAGPFNEYLARAPANKRSELASSWTTACSKLFGSSAVFVYKI